MPLKVCLSQAGHAVFMTLIKLKKEVLLRIDLEWEFVGVDGGGCDCRAKGKGATTEPLNKVEKRSKTNLTYIRTLPLK